MRNGGNMWSGWVSYLSFFRHVAKLPIDYSKWQHYEAAAIHAGPRYMHEKFWIVSDRPECVHKDSRHRPHRVGGPNLRWRDGWEIYSVAGIRVPRSVAMGEFGVAEIDEQRNAEVRRVMIDLYNKGDSGRYLRDSGARVVHSDVDLLGHPRRLFVRELPGDEPIVAFEVVNSTDEDDGSLKRYTFRVHPELRPLPVAGGRKTLGEPQEMTVHNAVASYFGLYGREYHPTVET
jgi:Domain of unknown function (DUF6745)